MKKSWRRSLAEMVLASASPRRKELLNLVGVNPRVVVPAVDESQLEGEGTEDFLRRVSVAKGQDVYRRHGGESGDLFGAVVISADTVVLCGDRLLGKPRDRAEAFEFLKLLSGVGHEVWTGLCLLYRGAVHYDCSRTHVSFNGMGDDEINYYLDNEKYMDKAGAYAIQGKASVFIKKIDGCFFNVMGFPLNLFYSMLKKLGIGLYRGLN